MAGPTSKPFMKSFACAGVVFVAAIIAALVFLGPPGDGPRMLGGLFAAVAIAALGTGFFARRSAKVWHIGRIIATYVVALVVILVFYAIGTKGH
jgi:hypothetical protein